MEIEIITQEKDLLEIRVNNITIAEVLRAYLNEQGIKFAAWKREHPEKPIILRVESAGKTAKKAISEAIAQIKKDLKTLK